MFQVELVWNREFNFVSYGPKHADIDKAISFAKSMENIGDGESIKKTRVKNEHGNVIWTNGRMVGATNGS